MEQGSAQAKREVGQAVAHRQENTSGGQGADFSDVYGHTGGFQRAAVFFSGIRRLPYRGPGRNVRVYFGARWAWCLASSAGERDI